ncbi:putative defense protein 3 [Panonychus citri]|uniref:putative defense protein 3 n=1 Tax=Panonychus citri TaxID=50023 RepID=UPI0023082039|nr:putative defense protein 3 [Panonychus citri]
MPKLSVMSYYCFVHLLIVITIIKLSSCFPSGAPADACENLTPRHTGTTPITENSPYTLKAITGNFEYSSSTDQGIKVRIDGPPFRGFFVIAVDAKTGERVGKWAQLKGTNTIDACSGITHGDNKRKKSATLLWIPPEKGSGGISFIATVVKSFSEYYTPITSEADKK